MAWGAEVRSYTLEDARDRDAAVAELAQRRRRGRAARSRRLAGQRDRRRADRERALRRAGRRRAARGSAPHEPRDHGARARPAATSSRVRWATDARYLAIEVRDRWGSLDAAAIAQRLARGGKQTDASEGGMGLPLAYACCNQFVIGVAPGALTEVIALLDVRYKPTELGRSASFHAFAGEARHDRASSAVSTCAIAGPTRHADRPDRRLGAARRAAGAAARRRRRDRHRRRHVRQLDRHARVDPVPPRAARARRPVGSSASPTC